MKKSKAKKQREACDQLIGRFRQVLAEFDFERSGGSAGLRYLLENRYQNRGWISLGRSYGDFKQAVESAAGLSRDSIGFGMVRVLDTHDGHVVIEFPAG